jgi:glycosyltransferase involved in cell wall biosynthesis
MSMRILQMISKNDRYGAQRIFLDQVKALHDLGNEVFVVARGNEGYVADSVRALGIPYIGIAMKGLTDVLFLRKFINEQSIDIIHTTLDRADYFGAIVAKLTGRRVVSTMMVPRCHPGFRFMDRIAVLSRMQQRLLEQKGISPDKITLIRPGIDVDRFSKPDQVKRSAWNEKLRIERFSPVFCHISSMLTRKAHSVSLKVVAACKKNGENPLLVIIGDPVEGEYYEALLRQARTDGIAENIFFTGWTRDIPEILSLSHFTILPSENEALGVVLMEGMAAGTPIIAREGEGGAELVIDYEVGFLYRPQEGISRLAEQITNLRRDATRFLSLSEKCRTIAMNEFSMKSYGRKLEDLYSSALRRKAGM